MAEDKRTEGPAPAPLASELCKTIEDQKAALVEQGSRIGFLEKQNKDISFAIKVEKEQKVEAWKRKNTWEQRNRILTHLNNQLEKTNRLNTRVIEKLLGDEDLEL